MSESTTEQTPTPEPPVWPTAPAIPAPTEVTRDSAMDADRMAASLRDDMALYRAYAVDALDRGIVVTREILDEVAELRRRVASTADLIARRRLSRPSTLAAQHAYRVAERVAGLAVAAGQAQGVVRTKATANSVTLAGPRDILGHAVDRCRQMAAGTESEFDAAIETTMSVSGPTYDYVLAALGSSGLSEAQRERRDILGRLAAAGNSSDQIAEAMGVTPYRVIELARQWGIEIPADTVTARAVTIDPNRVMESMLGILEGASASARLINPDVIAQVSPSQAADWAAALWDVCVPLVGLQNALKARGRA